jgi:ribosome-binding factor A
VADSVRIRRVAEQIRGELSQILRDEVQDPRIRLVTVTRVKLASDLGAATVFYSPLGEDPDASRATELKHAMGAVAGFCRRALAGRMKLRHTPQLRFILDDSIAQGAETLDVLRSLDLSKEEAPDASGDPSRAESSDEPDAE